MTVYKEYFLIQKAAATCNRLSFLVRYNEVANTVYSDFADREEVWR